MIIELELVYTWPDGRQEVRYRRPEGDNDILEWREIVMRANSPYSIRASDPDIQQIIKSRFQNVRDRIRADGFEFYLEGWKASDQNEEDCPYKDEGQKKENWIDGWSDCNCEP